MTSDEIESHSCYEEFHEAVQMAIQASMTRDELLDVCKEMTREMTTVKYFPELEQDVAVDSLVITTEIVNYIFDKLTH